MYIFFLQYTPVEYSTAGEESAESSPRMIDDDEDIPPPPPKPLRQYPEEEEPIIAAAACENLQSTPPSSLTAINLNHNNLPVDDENNTFQTSPTNGSTPSPVRPTTLTSPAYSARPYPGRQESNSPRIISPQKATGGKLVRPKPQYPPGSPKRAMKDSTTEQNHQENHVNQPRVGRVKPNNRPISIVSPESSRVTTDPEPSPDSKLFIKRLNEQKAGAQGSPRPSRAVPGPQVDGKNKPGPSNGKPKPPGGSPKSEADKGEKGDKKKSSVWYEYGCV